MKATPGTVGSALACARSMGVERLDAQLLVAHALGRDRTWVLAHDDAALDVGLEAALAALLSRRAAGEPLAYLVGEREFHGLWLRVTPDVLVPRPDTESLVDWALELLAEQPTARVIDLGTGSGAIALAIKRSCSRAEVHATDRSAPALAVARANGAALGLDVAWHAGDWWHAAPAGPFDLAVANPPYVAPNDPHLAALRHEPLPALTPEQDTGEGLTDLARITADAGAHLRRGAWLLLEHGADQAEAVCARLQAGGFDDVQTRADLAGRPRISGGRHAL